MARPLITRSEAFLPISDIVKTIIQSELEYYELPFEMWRVVFEYLKPVDLYNFMWSNKVFLKLVLAESEYITSNYSKTLNIDDIIILKLSKMITTNITDINLFKKIKFIHLINIFKYVSTDNYNELYNSCPQIIRNQSTSDEELQNINNVIIPTVLVSKEMYECKKRYALFYTYSHDILTTNNESVMLMIRYLKNNAFYNLFCLITDVPSIISSIHYNSLPSINVFFTSIWPNINFTVNDFINIVKIALYYGAEGPDIFQMIICNRFKSFIKALAVGVKRHDAYTIISKNNITDDNLINFKAFLPIVGYEYAKHFIIEHPLDLEEHPHFIQVASKLNSVGYISYDECKVLAKYPHYMERTLAFQHTQRKRKFEELLF
jgi:hypothetical protein